MKNITISLSDGDYNKLEQVSGKEDLSIYGLVKSMILQKIVLEVEQFRYKDPKTIDKVIEEEIIPVEELNPNLKYPHDRPKEVKAMFCKTCSGVKEFRDSKCIQCKTKAA